MTTPDLWTFLSAPSIELLGWVLLHFVWQGTLLAVVLAGALYVLRDDTPTARYAVSCAALAALLALPLVTGFYLYDAAPATAPTQSVSVDATTAALVAPGTSPAAETAQVQPTSTWRAEAAAWLKPALPWIVLAWVLGVLSFSVRLLSGAWEVRRLRASSEPAPEKWQDRLHALADRVGVSRGVGLRLCSRIDSPMVAGCWRPVVLVPAGLLTGLPPDQVEALLLHELAHVRRQDVLVGRLQAVVETLLFFHPATWWISRQVRLTREACCDDLAVRAGTDRSVYAHALTTLAERSLGTPPVGALAATEGSLLSRIQRLLDPAANQSSRRRRMSVAVAFLLLGGVAVGLGACASQQAATKSSSDETARGSAPSVVEEYDEGNADTLRVKEGKEALAHRERRSLLRRPDREARPPHPAVPSDPAPPLREDGRVGRLPAEDVQRVRVVRRDAAGGGILIVESKHGEVDTVHVAPGVEEDVEIERRRHFQRPLRHVPDPDTGRQSGWFDVDPDHWERTAHLLELRADSLGRALEKQINPDSLERVFEKRFRSDRLERRLRRQLNPDSLEREARLLALRADSVGRVIRREINPDSLAREVRSRVDVDSLKRVFRRRFDAESLRRHMEEMREHMEEAPKHLREQARRLRERAKELERRAEHLEHPPSPAAPPPPDTSYGLEDASEWEFDAGLQGRR